MLASWGADSMRIVKQSLPQRASQSSPLTLDGDIGYNVRMALDANGGALRRIVLLPGTSWSFNASVGDPRSLRLRVVGGVYGGGWCDLASRYVQALRPLLPPHAFTYVNHVASTGVRLANVADADAVAIWNIDGQPGTWGGRLDLVIANPLDVPIMLEAIEHERPRTVVIHAYLLP